MLKFNFIFHISYLIFYIQPIEKVWGFSKKWYGNHLNPEWKKWTVDEAKKIFKEFDLDHWNWDLEDSKSRF